MRYLCALVLVMNLINQANAVQNPAYQALFDGVCVGGGVDNTNMGELVDMMAEELDGSLDSFPAQQIARSGPETAEGWFMHTEAQNLMITRMEKKIDQEIVSTGCSISFEEDNPLEIVNFIESNYRVTKFVDEKQGLDHNRVYGVELLGFHKKSAIIIQSGNGIVALSLAVLQTDE